MDREFQQLLQVLPVREGSIPTILDYYESSDAASLTRKLRSIQAFKGILAPMKAVEGGFVPDFSSRYFTEDFPYGLHHPAAGQEASDTSTHHRSRHGLGNQKDSLMNQDELRARFNPDGSLLRRQQLRMLDILLEVDKICKKHDIRY